ncbi:unnamed protein product [Sphagnum troendelagicum]
MTSPQGMNELFWGRDHEDVNDWAERLTMVAEVRDLNADKLFKITKLNLRGRAKEWFKIIQPAPADWPELRTLIVQKYKNVDADDIRMRTFADIEELVGAATEFERVLGELGETPYEPLKEEQEEGVAETMMEK